MFQLSCQILSSRRGQLCESSLYLLEQGSDQQNTGAQENIFEQINEDLEYALKENIEKKSSSSSSLPEQFSPKAIRWGQARKTVYATDKWGDDAT